MWRTCKTKAHIFLIKPYKATLRSLKQESHDFSRWECQTEGCRTDLLTDNYQLCFIEVDNPYAEEDGELKELRIIYPDENNHMPWDEHCDETYKGQIADIPEEKIKEVLSKCN